MTKRYDPPQISLVELSAKLPRAVWQAINDAVSIICRRLPS